MVLAAPEITLEVLPLARPAAVFIDRGGAPLKEVWEDTSVIYIISPWDIYKTKVLVGEPKAGKVHMVFCYPAPSLKIYLLAFSRTASAIIRSMSSIYRASRWSPLTVVFRVPFL